MIPLPSPNPNGLARITERPRQLRRNRGWSDPAGSANYRTLNANYWARCVRIPSTNVNSHGS